MKYDNYTTFEIVIRVATHIADTDATKNSNLIKFAITPELRNGWNCHLYQDAHAGRHALKLKWRRM